MINLGLIKKMTMSIKIKAIINKFYLFITFFFSVYSGETNAQLNPNHAIGTISGNYYFNNTALPDNLIELISPVNGTGYSLAYQWESSLSADESAFTPITAATSSSYTFPAPLTQTT